MVWRKESYALGGDAPLNVRWPPLGKVHSGLLNQHSVFCDRLQRGSTPLSHKFGLIFLSAIPGTL